MWAKSSQLARARRERATHVGKVLQVARVNESR